METGNISSFGCVKFFAQLPRLQKEAEDWHGDGWNIDSGAMNDVSIECRMYRRIRNRWPTLTNNIIIYIFINSILHQKSTQDVLQTLFLCARFIFFRFKKPRPKSSKVFCESLGAVPRTEAAPTLGRSRIVHQHLQLSWSSSKLHPRKSWRERRLEKAGGNKRDDQNLHKTAKN